MLSMQRTPEPHEELLGFLLNNPKVAQEHTLQPQVFKEYATLYADMMQNEFINYVVLKRKLPQWADTITELATSALHVTETLVPYLVSSVKNNALKLNVERLCAETINKVHGMEADELLRELQEQSLKLQTSELGELQDPDKDVDEYLEYFEETMNNPSIAYGLMTGLYDLDSLTTGWHRQDFSVIGARTSIGKSAVAIANVLHLNENGYKCAIFSLEMSKRQIYNRMVSNRTGFSLEVIRTGKLDRGNLHKVKALKPKLANIYVDDTRGVSADYIVDTMRKLKRTRGLDFVLVDYIQDVKETGEQNDNGGSAMARICRKLRKGAQEMDCHVMGLSQIDRRVEQRQDKRPSNADLSGSTGIETSADVIAMLYRDDYYDRESDKKNIMEMVFTKQRNGKLGTVELAYLKDSQQILGLDRGR